MADTTTSETTVFVTDETIEYDDASFDFLDTRMKSEILRQSAELGVSSAAVAGAIIEEDDSNHSNPLTYSYQKAADAYAWERIEDDSPAELQRDFDEIISNGIDTPPSTREKLSNPLLIDVGPANIRISKAVDLLNKYAEGIGVNGDPLGVSSHEVRKCQTTILYRLFFLITSINEARLN